MKTSIVILPGWKLSGMLYKNLVTLCAKQGYETYAIDFPGFGTTKLESDSMTLNDYVEFVYRFIQQHKMSSIIIIGHSFGGRVAIKYAMLHADSVRKLVLTGVPVIRHTSLKKKSAYLAAVLGKLVLKIFPNSWGKFFRKVLYFGIGEWDYYKSGNLKNVFVNVINEDLGDYVKRISVSTLLVWGEKDTFTPVSDVEKIMKMNKKIQSILVKNATHRLPIDNPETFFKAVRSFL